VTLLLALLLAAALAALLMALRRLRRARGDLERLGQALQAARSAEQALREQAASRERERIYADLHDDLGAKLLGLIHRAPDAAYADAARAALQDLRDVVTRSRGTPGTLADVLGDIRAEAVQRLAAVGIGLRWEELGELPEPALDHAQSLHLHRIVREAISNVIRHARAQALRVRLRVQQGELQLELTDDGLGGAGGRQGAGMRGMRERAAELDADIHWTRGTAGGTKVLLTLPLQGLP